MSAPTRRDRGADGAPPEIGMMLPEGRLSWSGHMGLDSAPGDPGAHPRRRHDDRVRQHPRAGRTDVPGAVEAERADAADRHASRQPGGGAAPPGRGGDGGRRAARGGGDLVARPRHRLGRRGSGDPGGRAEGRVAAAAAGRAGQSPHGRSQPRACWCRPTASRCWSARPPSWASPRANWTAIRRGPAGSMCWRSICWAGLRRPVPAGCDVSPRCAAPRPMPACRARISMTCWASSRMAATRCSL